MTKQNILITGGAGFIGSHLCDLLVDQGHNVRILDNLDPQVHGENARRPSYLNKNALLMVGDVRNRQDVDDALENVDIVFHLAAKVGVGQSMYEIAEYTGVNNLGTAVLLEALIKNPPRKLVVASSMSIYGEGLYKTPSGDIIGGYDRDLKNLKNGKWELYDDAGEMMKPVATNEQKIPALSSVYALSKYDQERLCLITGRAYGFPVTALRFFNVYGTRQALSNPYTGVLAIFASRYLNEKAPLIFEDGEQLRDFVHVKDVARACYAASVVGRADGEVLNIGSGKSYSVNNIAKYLASVMRKAYIEPEITGKYRSGDIRHCFADISKAKQLIDYLPQVRLDHGLAELSQWLEGQIAFDRVDAASEELEKRGLTV